MGWDELALPGVPAPAHSHNIWRIHSPICGAITWVKWHGRRTECYLLAKLQTLVYGRKCVYYAEKLSFEPDVHLCPHPPAQPHKHTLLFWKTWTPPQPSLMQPLYPQHPTSPLKGLSTSITQSIFESSKLKHWSVSVRSCEHFYPFKEDQAD